MAEWRTESTNCIEFNSNLSSWIPTTHFLSPMCETQFNLNEICQNTTRKTSLSQGQSIHYVFINTSANCCTNLQLWRLYFSSETWKLFLSLISSFSSPYTCPPTPQKVPTPIIFRELTDSALLFSPDLSSFRQARDHSGLWVPVIPFPGLVMTGALEARHFSRQHELESLPRISACFSVSHNCTR